MTCADGCQPRARPAGRQYGPSRGLHLHRNAIPILGVDIVSSRDSLCVHEDSCRCRTRRCFKQKTQWFTDDPKYAVRRAAIRFKYRRFRPRMLRNLRLQLTVPVGVCICVLVLTGRHHASSFNSIGWLRGRHPASGRSTILGLCDTQPHFQEPPRVSQRRPDRSPSECVARPGRCRCPRPCARSCVSSGSRSAPRRC